MAKPIEDDEAVLAAMAIISLSVAPTTEAQFPAISSAVVNQLKLLRQWMNQENTRD